MTKPVVRQLHSSSHSQRLSYAGLVVACAFGDIHRMWSRPSNTAKAKGTVSEPQPLARQKSLNGSREGSNPSQAPEQKASRPDAPNFYKSKVVESAKRFGACHEKNRRYRRLSRYGFVKVRAY